MEHVSSIQKSFHLNAELPFGMVVSIASFSVDLEPRKKKKLIDCFLCFILCSLIDFRGSREQPEAKPVYRRNQFSI